MPETDNDIHTIFKEIVSALLFPLFPGTEFDELEEVEAPRRNKDKPVTSVGPSRLKLQCQETKNNYCQIKRTQPFDKEERMIIECFLRSIPRLYRDWSASYQSDTAASVMSEFVANSVSHDNNKFLQRIISVYSEWAQHTYEGQRITVSLGIKRAHSKFKGVSFSKILNDDFLKVLSNGYDTLLCFNQDGQTIGHVQLDHEKELAPGFYPLRYGYLAKWTAGNSNVVATLNRNGEIILFKGGNICFAKRRGHWRYFAHQSILRQLTNNAMGRKTSEEIRKAIYLTALDTAFSRTGGCIGVVNANKMNDFYSDNIVHVDDLLYSDSKKAKTIALNVLINDTNFNVCNRLFRSELSSIDGATIIDHSGKFIAVGAILSVHGGSSGGGRHLAAKTIAKYGLGIKISNDGYIEFFDKEGNTIAKLS